MGNITNIMQCWCDAIYPLPTKCIKHMAFFIFSVIWKKWKKNLLKSIKKGKFSFTLRLYVFWSQHKITFCENYIRRCNRARYVYYYVCTDVEIFKHKLHKTALTRAATTVDELHIWAQTCLLEFLIVKILRSF